MERLLVKLMVVAAMAQLGLSAKDLLNPWQMLTCKLSISKFARLNDIADKEVLFPETRIGSSPSERAVGVVDALDIEKNTELSKVLKNLNLDLRVTALPNKVPSIGLRNTKKQRAPGEFNFALVGGYKLVTDIQMETKNDDGWVTNFTNFISLECEN